MKQKKGLKNNRHGLNNTNTFVPRIIHSSDINFTKEEELLDKGNKFNTKEKFQK